MSTSLNIARILACEAGLSTTTTSEGLFDEARTRPQVPSSSVTRTPFTVTTDMIFWPSSFSPFSARAEYSFTIASTTAYFFSSGQKGAMVGEPQLCGRASYSDDSFAPAPALSSISSTWMPATMPSS